VRELVYKRGFGNLSIRASRSPTTRSSLTSWARRKGLQCKEDLIHEIYTVGPSVKQAANFLTIVGRNFRSNVTSRTRASTSLRHRACKRTLPLLRLRRLPLGLPLHHDLWRPSPVVFVLRCTALFIPTNAIVMSQHLVCSVCGGADLADGLSVCACLLVCC